MHRTGTSRELASRIGLGLVLMERVAVPGVRYSCDEIASWCGCSFQNIHYIERRALRKIRRSASAQKFLQELKR